MESRKQTKTKPLIDTENRSVVARSVQQRAEVSKRVDGVNCMVKDDHQTLAKTKMSNYTVVNLYNAIYQFYVNK